MRGLPTGDYGGDKKHIITVKNGQIDEDWEWRDKIIWGFTNDQWLLS